MTKSGKTHGNQPRSFQRTGPTSNLTPKGYGRMKVWLPADNPPRIRLRLTRLDRGGKPASTPYFENTASQRTILYFYFVLIFILEILFIIRKQTLTTSALFRPFENSRSTSSQWVAMRHIVICLVDLLFSYYIWKLEMGHSAR